MWPPNSNLKNENEIKPFLCTSWDFGDINFLQSAARGMEKNGIGLSEFVHILDRCGSDPLCHAILSDDVDSLSNIISSNSENIDSIDVVMDMCSHGDYTNSDFDNLRRDSSGHDRLIYLKNWVGRTDCFSAAVYLKAKKCVAWSLNNNFVTIDRNIAPFACMYEFNEREISSFKKHCVRGLFGDFRDFISSENEYMWRGDNQSKGKIDSDCLKSFLFDAAKRGNNSEFYAGNISCNMNTVLGLEALGCDPKLFLDIAPWIENETSAEDYKVFHLFLLEIENYLMRGAISASHMDIRKKSL